MADFRDDIERYRKGELTASEMHALEKRALHDPFLADALEGADSVDPLDFSSDVAELNQRIGRKKPFWLIPFRIAAGIALIIGATFLIYRFVPTEDTLALHSEKQKEQAASATPSQQSLADSVNKDKKPIVTQLSRKENSATSAKETKHELPKRSLAAKAPITKEKPVTGESIIAPEPTASEVSSDKSIEAARAEPSLEAAKLDVLTNTEEREKVAAAEMAKPAGGVTRDMAAKKSITPPATELKAIKEMALTGTVTDSDGSPIPGVNVIIKGTTNGTVTDGEGNYKLTAPADNPELVFSFIGYQTKEVVASQAKNDISMGVDVSQLSEVVVTGYGVSKADDNDEPVIRLAEPVGGRKAYDKYLDDHLRYPTEALANKIKGKVTVEFTVRTDGSLDEFNVIKSLGHGCDDEVLRLVKEGPRWNPTTRDNTPIESTVRVKMKFDPAKTNH